MNKAKENGAINATVSVEPEVSIVLASCQIAVAVVCEVALAIVFVIKMFHKYINMACNRSQTPC